MVIQARYNKPSRLDKITPQELAAEYIPSASEIAEMGHRQLEVEIGRLQIVLAEMRRHADRTRSTEKLPDREQFMELAATEFRRTRRHNRELSLIVATIVGYDDTLDTYGENTANQLVSEVSETCSKATRIGIDLIGRIGPDRIAILLPETGTQNSNLCLARIYALLEEMPLRIKGRPAETSLSFSARTLRETHNSFLELLVSA